MTIPQQLRDTPESTDVREKFSLNLSGRYRIDRIFAMATWLGVAIAIGVLVILLSSIFWEGFSRLSWQFISSFPSRKPEEAGLLSALGGTIWLMLTITVIAFPLGVGAGIYLEEFARESWLAKLIEININNLAGVPSIIYGLLGLQLFVRVLQPITGGRSILSGALTLSLLILPIVIVATRESLRAVPDSLRQAGFALGATEWQVVSRQVLPLAFPGILTGTILALSRAIGETAPLLTIGALTFISFLPDVNIIYLFGFIPIPNLFNTLQSQFTVMPIQIYNWVSRPQQEFHVNAAAGIIVLMVVLLAMNGTAVFLRNKFQKRSE